MERATGTPETECPAGVTHKQRIETTRGGKKRRQAPPAAQTNKKQRKDADRSYPFHSSLGESSGTWGHRTYVVVVRARPDLLTYFVIDPLPGRIGPREYPAVYSQQGGQGDVHLVAAHAGHD